jgi:hypothetical protein
MKSGCAQVAGAFRATVKTSPSEVTLSRRIRFKFPVKALHPCTTHLRAMQVLTGSVGILGQNQSPLILLAMSAPPPSVDDGY